MLLVFPRETCPTYSTVPGEVYECCVNSGPTVPHFSRLGKGQRSGRLEHPDLTATNVHFSYKGRVPYLEKYHVLATRFSITFLVLIPTKKTKKRKVNAKSQICVDFAFYARETEDPQCRFPSRGLAGMQNFALRSQ